MSLLDGSVGWPDDGTKCFVVWLGNHHEFTHMRSHPNLTKGCNFMNQWVDSPMGKETQWVGAYKGTRAHNQEGNLEDKERNKCSSVLRKTKREISLKEPSHSTWEDLCCHEVDSLDKVRRDYFESVLGKYRNMGLLEACVSQNRNLWSLWKRRDNKSVLEGTSKVNRWRLKRWLQQRVWVMNICMSVLVRWDNSCDSAKL